MRKFSKIIAFSIVTTMLMSSLTAVAAVRQIADEKDGVAKTKYNQAREMYLNQVREYRTARQNFRNAKSKFQKMRNAENRKQYEAKTRKFLQKTVAAMVRYVEALKNKTENVRGISEEERNVILISLGNDINWLKKKEAQLMSDSGLTAGKIKEEAAAIRSRWRDIKVNFKKTIAEIWVARVSYVISRAEEFAGKAALKIEDLKASGSDVSKLESWLQDLNDNIAKAKEKRDQAKENISNIAEVKAGQIFSSVHRFVREADQYIKKSHSQMVRIVREMKKAEGGATAE